MSVRIAVLFACLVAVTDAQEPKNAQPTKSQIRDQASALLKLEAIAKSESTRLGTTLELVALAGQIRADERFTTSPLLKKTLRRITARLRTIKKRTIARSRRGEKNPATISIEPKVLAQLNAAVNAMPRPNPNRANVAAVPVDFGPDLVALIQATIAPSSWDVNGGYSTVQYWRPGMALVVRAPQGVHSQVSPLLGQLRAN